MIEFELYDRNSFTIDAVQVTKQNIVELAQINNAYVQTERIGSIVSEFFTIPILSPGRPAQFVKVYVGNWFTVRDGSPYRYTDKKFQAIFTKRMPLQTSLDSLRSDISDAIEPLMTGETRDINACIDQIFRVFGIK